MEEKNLLHEIGKLVETLLRQWQLVLGLALISAIAAGLFSIVLPKEYEAKVVVASTRTLATVSFGSAMETFSEEQLLASGAGAYRLLDPEARLQSYVEQVSNPDIAVEILGQFSDRLQEDLGEEVEVADVLRMVDGQILKNSDSVVIIITAGDPILAADMANAWGKAYARQLNSIYTSQSGDTGSYDTVQQKAEEAKERYNETQQRLVGLIKDSEVDELTRQVNELQTTIDSLSLARNEAIDALVKSYTDTELEVLQEYIEAASQNQQLILQYDYEGRRALVQSFVEALNQGRQITFSEQVDDLSTELSVKYANLRQVNQLLNDASDMRKQVQAGGSGAVLSNSLALTLLKVRAFALTDAGNMSQDGSNFGLGSVDLQVDPLVVPVDFMVSDLNSLVQTLEDRQSLLEEEIQSLSETLASGEGYTFLDLALEPSDEMAALIQEKYAELWEVGALTELSQGLFENGTPLQRDAKAIGERLLQLEGVEDALGFSVEETPLELHIKELGVQLRELKSKLAEEEDQRRELARARDLAWTTYTTLATKGAELEVVAGAGGSAVALAVPASVPDRDTVSGARNVVLAGVTGLFLGVALVYILEFWWAYKGITPQAITIKRIIKR